MRVLHRLNCFSNSPNPLIPSVHLVGSILQQCRATNRMTKAFGSSLGRSMASEAKPQCSSITPYEFRTTFLKDFYLNREQVQYIYDQFTAEVCEGLRQEGSDLSDIKCWVTYVQDLPTGNETGKYLALDLGGTNFRVLCVTLKGKGKDVIESQVFPLSKELITGPGKELFYYIADALALFAQKHNLGDKNLSLGFTFSFPCIQMSLTKAKLVRWTKGFKSPDVENKDVGRLLREAINVRGGAKINVVAILNDTTGTLMSCAHRNPECRIGLIIGTGSNACYVERVVNAKLLSNTYKNKPKIIINLEWGAFGDSGSLNHIRTEYDRAIDENSVNKGTQLFEKMIGGMYLGELVRRVLLDAVLQDLIFKSAPDKSQLKCQLCQKGCIKTSMLSEIEADDPVEMTITHHILLETLKLNNVTHDDCMKLRIICSVVCSRAAHLVGIGLSNLINRINEPKIIVGVDGSVYRYHPKFDMYMRQQMDALVNPHITYDIMLSEDGSGRGAALVAAVAEEQSRKKIMHT